MGRHQGAVDVEDGELRVQPGRPYAPSGRRAGGGDARERLRRERLRRERLPGAPHGRGRCDRAEQGRLVAENRDIDQRGRPVGNRHGHLHEHVTPVIAPLRERAQCRRAIRGQTGPVGEVAQHPRPDVSHNAVVTSTDLKAGERCGPMPRGSALLDGYKWSLSNPIIPHPEDRLREPGPVSPARY